MTKFPANREGRNRAVEITDSAAGGIGVASGGKSRHRSARSARKISSRRRRRYETRAKDL